MNQSFQYSLILNSIHRNTSMEETLMMKTCRLNDLSHAFIDNHIDCINILLYPSYRTHIEFHHVNLFNCPLQSHSNFHEYLISTLERLSTNIFSFILFPSSLFSCSFFLFLDPCLNFPSLRHTHIDRSNLKWPSWWWYDTKSKSLSKEGQ